MGLFFTSYICDNLMLFIIHYNYTHRFIEHSFNKLCSSCITKNVVKNLLYSNTLKQTYIKDGLFLVSNTKSYMIVFQVSNNLTAIVII